MAIFDNESAWRVCTFSAKSLASKNNSLASSDDVVIGIWCLSGLQAIIDKAIEKIQSRFLLFIVSFCNILFPDKFVTYSADSNYPSGIGLVVTDFFS